MNDASYRAASEARIAEWRRSAEVHRRKANKLRYLLDLELATLHSYERSIIAEQSQFKTKRSK